MSEAPKTEAERERYRRAHEAHYGVPYDGERKATTGQPKAEG